MYENRDISHSSRRCTGWCPEYTIRAIVPRVPTGDAPPPPPPRTWFGHPALQLTASQVAMSFDRLAAEFGICMNEWARTIGGVGDRFGGVSWIR